MINSSCRSSTISYRYLVCLLICCLSSSTLFFLVEQYPLQFSSILSTSTINSRIVLCQFHAKDRLKYNQTVTEKFEQCCKVTDNTVMVVIFTVDVNIEIIQMKYLLICTRMKLGLVQSPAYNIDTVYFMDWSF